MTADRYVVAAPVTWPTPPGFMSVSALADIEACPMRWTLTHAGYEGARSESRYPAAPSIAAITGTTVHRAIEIVLRAFSAAGISDFSDAGAVAVLRQLGGFTQILEELVAKEIAELASNFRAAQRLPQLERALRGRIPEMRSQVQGLLARLSFTPGASGLAHGVGAGRRSLGAGTFSEVNVSALTPAWRGIIDLVTLTDSTCEIRDFKTGARHPQHIFQVQVYALLWARDARANPSGRLATRLVLSYPDGEADAPVLGPMEVELLEANLTSRAQSAVNSIAGPNTATLPSQENCRFCSVRQLCEPYWESDVQATATVERTVFGDIEVEIGSRRGPLTWNARTTRRAVLAADTELVVQYDIERGEITDGQRIRLMQVAVTLDSENQSGLPSAAVTRESELFHLQP